MGQPLSIQPLLRLAPLAAFGLLTQPAPAQAHVKWFCAFDVAGQPRGLETVLCLDFEVLNGLALVLLLAGCLLEPTPLGRAMSRALDRTTASVRDHTPLLMRAVCGFFFVSVWAIGGLILTPELTTTAGWVPFVHLGIAAALVWRRTLPLAALGIVGLYGVAIQQYGLFHLMDYPIFLGVAAYLACIGTGFRPFGREPLDLVRWAAGITLMWASIEKWAYPEWTFPLFVTHPAMTMGYADEYFMRAAGVVEFASAFALLWTPLVRRIAALMLTGAFITAVAEFGKIDAVGHSAIIVVLIAIAADGRGAPATVRRAVAAPFGYGLALTGFLAAYYVAHAALFGAA